MSNKAFITLLVLAVIGEHILAQLTAFPVAYVPMVIIMYLLMSNDSAQALVPASVAGFAYDFFSGTPFGLSTALFLSLFALIVFVKLSFNINGRSVVPVGLSTIAFSIIFLGLMALIMHVRPSFSYMAVMLIELGLFFVLTYGLLAMQVHPKR